MIKRFAVLIVFVLVVGCDAGKKSEAPAEFAPPPKVGPGKFGGAPPPPPPVKQKTS
jgi:hypothetical protein